MEVDGDQQGASAPTAAAGAAANDVSGREGRIKREPRNDNQMALDVGQAAASGSTDVGRGSVVPVASTGVAQQQRERRIVLNGKNLPFNSGGALTTQLIARYNVMRLNGETVRLLCTSNPYNIAQLQKISQTGKEPMENQFSSRRDVVRSLNPNPVSQYFSRCSTSNRFDAKAMVNYFQSNASLILAPSHNLDETLRSVNVHQFLEQYLHYRETIIDKYAGANKTMIRVHNSENETDEFPEDEFQAALYTEGIDAVYPLGLVYFINILAVLLCSTTVEELQYPSENMLSFFQDLCDLLRRNQMQESPEALSQIISVLVCQECKLLAARWPDLKFDEHFEQTMYTNILEEMRTQYQTGMILYSGVLLVNEMETKMREMALVATHKINSVQQERDLSEQKFRNEKARNEALMASMKEQDQMYKMKLQQNFLLTQQGNFHPGTQYGAAYTPNPTGYPDGRLNHPMYASSSSDASSASAAGYYPPDIQPEGSGGYPHPPPSAPPKNLPPRAARTFHAAHPAEAVHDPIPPPQAAVDSVPPPAAEAQIDEELAQWELQLATNEVDLRNLKSEIMMINIAIEEKKQEKETINEKILLLQKEKSQTLDGIADANLKRNCIAHFNQKIDKLREEHREIVKTGAGFVGMISNGAEKPQRIAALEMANEELKKRIAERKGQMRSD